MFTEAIQTFDLIDFIRLIASSIFLTERIQENSLIYVTLSLKDYQPVEINLQKFCN